MRLAHGGAETIARAGAIVAAMLAGAVSVFSAGQQLQSGVPVIVGDEWVHVAVAGETWASIGARQGVTPAILAARNGRTLRTPLAAGEAIVIDNRHLVLDPGVDGLLINVAQRLVFYFADGRLLAHYPIAAGRPDWQTPLGPFSVVLRETDPTWDVPPSIQQEMRRARKPILTTVPPGPNNPLGQYWLGLSIPGVGLHGTNAPTSIYQFATHGCIRLHPEDIDALFAHVEEGEQGRIVYEPVLVAYDGRDVYVEIHPDRYRRAGDPMARVLALLDGAGVRELVDMEELADAVRRAEGLAVPVTKLK
ncbi:MAG TPA: L,D-transpeptidase [Vicinamibacterales bacterium]|nr:L,D-transpeptidase [Vicinamibacterales bacterium]